MRKSKRRRHVPPKAATLDKNHWIPVLLAFSTISVVAGWTVCGHLARGVVLHKSKPYYLASDPVSFWIFNLPPLLCCIGSAVAAIFVSLLMIRERAAFTARSCVTPVADELPSL